MLVASTGAMAEKAPATISENPNNVTAIETPEIKTDPMNNTEVVSFAAEQEHEMKIKKLDQKMHRLEDALLKKTDELHSVQSSLQHTYEKATEYSGINSKHRLHGFEYELSELAMQMGKEQVASHEILSDNALNELLGKLLSLDGPLKKYTEQIASISGNQLGSTVMMNTDLPGKYESEDMSIHKHLGTDPKNIVKKSLEIVDIRNQLEQAQKELNDLLGSSSEMVAKN